MRRVGTRVDTTFESLRDLGTVKVGPKFVAILPFEVGGEKPNDKGWIGESVEVGRGSKRRVGVVSMILTCCI